jgi:hypothetical protein
VLFVTHEEGLPRSSPLESKAAGKLGQFIGVGWQGVCLAVVHNL